MAPPPSDPTGSPDTGGGRTRTTSVVLCAVFFLSGASALVFETLWFRRAGLAFGNGVLLVAGFPFLTELLTPVFRPLAGRPPERSAARALLRALDDAGDGDGDDAAAPGEGAAGDGRSLRATLWTGCGLDWMLVGRHDAGPPVSAEHFALQRQDPVV